MPDFLTLPQVLLYEDVNAAIRELREKHPLPGVLALSRIDAEYLPLIFAIVAEWKIAGISEHPTIDDFPMTPRLASATLISQIVGEITRMYRGETEIPNG